MKRGATRGGGRPPRLARAVLEALRAADGGEVSAVRLLDAMFPEGWDHLADAASCLQLAVGRVRAEGHDVRGFASTGFRLVALSVRPDTRKERRCLGGCGAMFESEGPGNRICAGCAASERRRDPNEAYSLGRL